MIQYNTPEYTVLGDSAFGRSAASFYLERAFNAAMYASNDCCTGSDMVNALNDAISASLSAISLSAKGFLSIILEACLLAPGAVLCSGGVEHP